jgi:hypothetical protein
MDSLNINRSVPRISLDKVKVKVKVTLRLTVSQSVSQYVLVSGTPFGPMTRFYFFLSFVAKLLFSSPWAPSLTRGRVCNLQCNLSVVRVAEDSQPYITVSLDVLRWTLYRTPVVSLENAVLCCALFTKPYHSNDGAVLLRVCVAMGMLLHGNEHLQISTVANRLSMFATCGRIPWEAPTLSSHFRTVSEKISSLTNSQLLIYI